MIVKAPYPSHKVLPSAAALKGVTVRIHAPNGLLYEARSSGINWIPENPIHVGTTANRPGAADVLPGSVVVLTDDSYKNQVTNGSAWTDIGGGGGGGSGISLAIARKTSTLRI